VGSREPVRCFLLCKWWSTLATFEGVYRSSQAQNLGGQLATADTLAHIKGELKKLELFFTQHEMPLCRKAAAFALFQLDKPRIDVSSVVSAIHSFMEAVIQQFEMTHLVRISEEKSTYLDRTDLFGGKVTAAFPLPVLDEIREVGNCLALDLNNGGSIPPHARC